MVIRDGETNWEHGEAMWESIFQTKCTQKPLAQLFELEDPWCSYAGFYLWAWSLCHGLGYHLQHLEEHARPQDTYAWLIVFFLVTNHDCVLMIQNITFPKILYTPKLKWHFGIQCRRRSIFISVFKNVTWQFGFKVERQMKFVKHRHWLPMIGEIFGQNNRLRSQCLQLQPVTCSHHPLVFLY